MPRMATKSEPRTARRESPTTAVISASRFPCEERTGTPWSRSRSFIARPPRNARSEDGFPATRHPAEEVVIGPRRSRAHGREIRRPWRWRPPRARRGPADRERPLAARRSTPARRCQTLAKSRPATSRCPSSGQESTAARRSSAGSHRLWAGRTIDDFALRIFNTVDNARDHANAAACHGPRRGCDLQRGNAHFLSDGDAGVGELRPALRAPDQPRRFAGKLNSGAVAE